MRRCPGRSARCWRTRCSVRCRSSWPGSVRCWCSPPGPSRWRCRRFSASSAWASPCCSSWCSATRARAEPTRHRCCPRSGGRSGRGCRLGPARTRSAASRISTASASTAPPWSSAVMRSRGYWERSSRARCRSRDRSSWPISTKPNEWPSHRPRRKQGRRYAAPVRSIEELVVNIFAAIVVFALGVGARSAVSYIRSRRGRRFWGRHIIGGRTRLFLGSFDRDYILEPSGFVGLGDNHALYELATELGRLGVFFEIAYASRLMDNQHRENLILLGFGDVNSLAPIVLAKIGTGFVVDVDDMTITDTQTRKVYETE